MCVAYGWSDPLALVNDFKADLQQALRNHEQAGRAGAIKIFAPSGGLDAKAGRKSCGWRSGTNLATEGLHILAMTSTDAVSPIGTRVNSLPHCSFLAKPSSNAVEPTPRLLQLRRGERLIFQHDLLLEEVAEAFRFGCNPLADRG